MIRHRSPISGVTAYSDRYIATAGYDNQVILWNLQTGLALGRVCHDHLANQCDFNTDGSRLVSASSDYTARIWSVPDLRLQAVLGDHDDDVEMAIFHPTEDLVATASRDHSVRVFSGDGRLVHRFDGHTADALSVQWVAGTTDLISSGDDGTIRRWSLDSGRQVRSFDLGGIETDTVVVSPEGVVYAGTDSGDIVVLAGDARSSVAAHDAGVKRLAYSSEQALLASVSYDRTVKIWSVQSDALDLIAEAVMPADVWARACTFGPGTKLFFGTFGARFREYDYRVQQWGEPAPATMGINAVCSWGGARYTIGDSGWLWKDGVAARDLGSLCNFLLPCGDHLLTGGQMGVLFDALDGSVVHQHRSPLNCGAAYQVDGERRAVIGTYTGEGLIVKQTRTGIEFLEEIQLHHNAVKGLAHSEDTIFSVCADTGCTWTNAKTYQTQFRLKSGHTRIANGCVGLSGGRFLSISRDRRLRLWTGFSSEAFGTPHQNSVKCLAIDASGRFAASGSYGGHFGVFDIQTSRWPLFTRLSAAGISSIAYDALRRCFLASSYDGEVHEVELPAHDS